ncbi:uncharacterized protein [Venturia canescens]|nr:uncharacterized protein LOC122417700 isoform X2 [Venturia canescens]XP_043287410.1 uncharacterized protein LOC122417700 isoform X2 [Venturia canescens]
MTKRRHRSGSTWKIGSAIIIILMIFVLAIAGIAFWLGAIRGEPKNAIVGFSCSFRVTRGEHYNPMLKLNTSMVFREKERKYKNIFELLFRKSALGTAYKDAVVDRFENGLLKIFFRLYLDRRKIPRTLTNIEDTIQDIIARETYSSASLFKDMELDLTSISVRRINAELVKSPKPNSQQQRNTMITKNGLLRPSRNSSLVSGSKSKTKPVRMEPNEADIDFSNIPTIQGTYQATKLNLTKGPSKSETRNDSSSVNLKKDETNKERNSSAARNPGTTPGAAETATRMTNKMADRVTQATKMAEPPTSTPPPRTPPAKDSTTKENPFNEFRKPDLETSPWKPIIPDFGLPDAESSKEQATEKISASPGPETSKIKVGPEISVTTESGVSDATRFSLAPLGPSSFESPESDFPRDRIVPHEMVNFRPNSKFKNKIPGVEDEPAPEIEVSGHLPPETYDLHLGTSADHKFQHPNPDPSRFPASTATEKPSVWPNRDLPISQTPSMLATLPGSLPIDWPTSGSGFGSSGVGQGTKISGIGVAEPVLDLEFDPESRNRFTDILAIDSTLAKPLRDQGVEPKDPADWPGVEDAPESKQPIYTSYRTPDLNGGAKPSLVENPGTLKPFRHTIPVDKITPALVAVPELKIPISVEIGSTSIEPETLFAADSDAVSAQSDKTSGPLDKSKPEVGQEQFSQKIEIVDDLPPSLNATDDKTIDDDTILRHPTTEKFSEVYPPKPSGGKLAISPEIVTDLRRNSTFVEIGTVPHEPGPKPGSGSSQGVAWQPGNVPAHQEIGKKVYNDTLKANIVENVVTMAPAKSNTGVGRPLRPRPKIDKDKSTRLLEKDPESSADFGQDVDLLKKLFGLEDRENGGSGDGDHLVTGESVVQESVTRKDRPVLKQPIVEVVTSISTKVSSKIKTDQVVLRFEITNSTSGPEIHDRYEPIASPAPGDRQAPEGLEENRSFRDGTEIFENSDERLFLWSEKRPALVAEDLKSFDRKISSNEEVIEKLKKFAEVRIDNDPGKRRENNSTKHLDRLESQKIPPPQSLVNFEALKKIADLATGHKTRANNTAHSFTLSRDGLQVLTKVLNKADERIDETINSTTEKYLDTTFIESYCDGFRCNDGKCLPSEGRCNMLGECSNSEDENDCTCADFLKAQSLNQKICDGTPDCWDYSDENECDWCSEGQFVCGNSRSCVDQTRVCDGFKDCPSGEDEKKCAALIDDDEMTNIVEKRISTSLEFVTEPIYSTEPKSYEFYEEETREKPSEHSDIPEDQDAVESAILETTTFRIVVENSPDSKKLALGREISGTSKNRADHSANSIRPTKIDNSFERNEIRNEINGYSDRGFLSIRKNGKWGKLCLTGMDNLLEEKRTIWTIEDLGRAVCKAVTYQDYERVEKVYDEKTSRQDRIYYSLFYNEEKHSEKTSLTFRPSECPSGEVLRVKCKNLECGIRTQTTSQARIVGGGSSETGSWPWQVALYKEGEYQCGGALIRDRWILSAAHCFYQAKYEFWVARIGATRRGSFPSPHEQLLIVDEISPHPDYIHNGFINDVALLRLEKSVTFSDYVRPICLPSAEPKSGVTCTVTGWGQLFELGRIYPDTLQEVELPVLSTEECRRKTLFLPLYKITSGMLCAGLKDGGRDACLGDSGGPLVCPGLDNRYTLHGITSNGYGCARPGRPGVYTKVHHYITWIERTISKLDSPSSIPSCKGHRCPLGECLPMSRVCNGYLECSDGSDERDCPLTSQRR